MIDSDLLVILADQLDDIEKRRKATRERLRSLTDPDRHGYPDDEGAVLMVQAFLDQDEEQERKVVKVLEEAMADHPLGPWVQSLKGVGLKSVGRLLGAVGDPLWNSLHERPRTLAELRAYCGMHVVDGQAPKRRTGVKSNWSNRARTALWVIAESAYRQGDYKKVYEAAREHYADAVHTHHCRNTIKPRKGKPVGSNGCGTTAHPEWGEPGSPLRPGHQHARAKRMVARAILEDLYLAAQSLESNAE